MAVFSVYGLTAATSATANHCVAELWNPDSAKRIKVLEIGMFKTGVGATNDSINVCRTTVKGTAGSTVTPDADNSWSGDDVPSSGVTLELANFTTNQPTRVTPYLYGHILSAGAEGGGFVWPCSRGIWVPPGEGLALVQRTAAAMPASTVYFVWEE